VTGADDPDPHFVPSFVAFAYMPTARQHRQAELAECESREQADTEAEEHGETAQRHLAAMLEDGDECAPGHPRGQRCHHERAQADSKESKE
jgi:hypothetical protein